MSDARDLVQREVDRMGECRRHDFGLGPAVTCTCEDPRHAARALAGALRAVLDKCDELDQTDHVVAKAFAGEFRYRIIDALAGDSDA